MHELVIPSPDPLKPAVKSIVRKCSEKGLKFHEVSKNLPSSAQHVYGTAVEQEEADAQLFIQVAESAAAFRTARKAHL